MEKFKVLVWPHFVKVKLPGRGGSSENLRVVRLQKMPFDTMRRNPRATGNVKR